MPIERAGLWYPDQTFKSRDTILVDSMKKGELPILKTPTLKRLTFTDYWSPRFVKRQDEVLEAREQLTNNVEIQFPQEPICINFIGDLHTGGECNYLRVAEEMEAIVKTPSSYVMLMGDVIDGFFFNYAQMEQIEQVPEQIQYTKALLNYLGQNHKLLVGWAGDHDKWADKMGNSMYADFFENTGAYYMYGMGYVNLNVGKISYKLTGAHKLPGSSIYNQNHPQDRAMRFGGAWGSDIIVSAHNHKKSHSEKTVKGFGGEAVRVHEIALGPYKTQDEYSKKNGWSKQVASEMFGSSVILDPNEKYVRYYDDILRANNELLL